MTRSRCTETRSPRSGEPGAAPASEAVSRASLHPGTLTTRGVMAHWRVDDAAAIAILRAAGAAPIDPKARPFRWSWSDVWRCEGLAHVERLDWTRMKKPLLRTRDLVEMGAEDVGKGGSARTWRRRLALGRVPSVRLSATLRRVRPADFERALPFL